METTLGVIALFLIGIAIERMRQRLIKTWEETEPTAEEIKQEYKPFLDDSPLFNYCLRCGSRANYYGTAWIGSDGSGDCSREVCVLCLESSQPYQLAYKAKEIHLNCDH